MKGLHVILALGFIWSGGAWGAPIDPVAITLSTPADVVARRAALIDEIWRSTVLPGTLPTVDITNDPFGSALPDVASVYDYHAAMSNEQVNDSDLYVNSQPNGRVVILNMGHQGTNYWPSFAAGYGTLGMMTALLNAGFSIFAMNMPAEGIAGYHVALFSTYGNTAMQYFLEPAIQAMNYWDVNSTFSQYDFIGLSGGAWTGTLLQALDTRVRSAILDAGSLPGTQFCCWTQPLSELPNQGDLSEGGAEQSWAPFYSLAGYTDLYLMGASGSGRSQTQILNLKDDCCFGPLEWNPIYSAANQGRDWYQQVAYYDDLLKKAASDIPSRFSVIEDPTATQHQISSFAANLAVRELLATPIPEPSAFALALAGLAGSVLSGRHFRSRAKASRAMREIG